MTEIKAKTEAHNEVSKKEENADIAVAEDSSGCSAKLASNDASSIPAMPIALVFDNSSVVVNTERVNLFHRILKGNAKEKTILSNAFGIMVPGKLVALMGASGAGKSTLLTLLSTHSCHEKITGTIKYNDTPIDNEYKNHICFIRQEDIFLGFLTVEEHLRYMIRLTLPHLNTDEIESRISESLSVFGLEKCRRSQIGNVLMGAKRGISGGEKKRLSIATELLMNPSIIFADEPTSGLDSYMAESVILILKKLSNMGRTVISTIHQPSSEIFSVFDELLLLSEGKVLFHGSTADAITHFSRLGYKCPMNLNPAEFFIEICSIKENEREKRLKLLNEWVDDWKQNKPNYMKERTILQNESLKKYEELLKCEKNMIVNRKNASMINQIRILTQRSLTMGRRNPLLFHTRLVQAVFSGLLLGFIYFQLDYNNTMSKNGLCFYLLLNQIIVGLVGVLQTFTSEKLVVTHDIKSHNYSSIAYYIAKTTSDIPFQISNPIITTTLIWWLAGLRDSAAHFFLALFFIILLTNIGITYGYCISIMSKNFREAIAFMPLVLFPQILLCGFFILYSNLPDFWYFLSHLSFFRWGFAAILKCVWQGVELPQCPEDMLPPRCFDSGEAILEFYGINVSYTIITVILLAFFVCGRLFGLFTIWYKTRTS